MDRSRWYVPGLSFGIAIALVTVIPLTVYCAPLAWDRYGPQSRYASAETGISLSYPSRWHVTAQTVPSDVPGGGAHASLVLTPPSRIESAGGIEINAYPSEAAYLSERNWQSQRPYGSLSDFLGALDRVGSADVAGAQRAAYLVDGEEGPSTCFIVPGQMRLYTVCADGVRSSETLSAPQRLVLERTELSL